MGRVYDICRTGLLNGQVDPDHAVLKVACLSTYTFDPTHQSMADIGAAGGVVNGISTGLTGVAVTGGVLTADPTSIGVGASGNDHSLLLFQASAPGGGADVILGSQLLIGYLDTGAGLPIQPTSAGTVTITWASDGVLRLDPAPAI